MSRNNLVNIVLKPSQIFATIVILLLSVFSMLASAAPTDTIAAGSNTSTQRFDHMATGYALTGAHTITECSSCHVGGVFKGTPHNCNGCHTKGQRVVAISMSSTHFPTTEQCDVCHTNSVTFSGALYNHGKAIPGQCATCHNGLVATGRTSSHSSNSFKATNSCDTCHRTSTWLPSFWNHVGAISQCGNCHAQGQMGAIYVKTNIGGTSVEGFAHNPLNNAIDCISCHHSYTNWLGAGYDHAAAGGTCSSCHNGNRATGTAQFTGHVITPSDCSSCHHSFASWLGASFNHTGITAACSSCHNGTIATGKNVLTGTTPEALAHNSQNNALDCKSCHQTFANWLGAAYDHAGSAGACSSCHNGSRATGTAQFAGHVSIGTSDCGACHHGFTSWLGASFDHTGITSACSSCHNGTIATGKNVLTGTTPEALAHNSQNNALDCKSCHQTFANWLGAAYDHAGAAGACSSCHNGSRATGTAQFSGHVAIGTSDCSTCHTTTTTWLGAIGGMPSNHVAATFFQPATVACSACHPTAATWITGSSLHGFMVSTPCVPCHRTGANVLGAQTHNHHSPTDCGASGCHNSYNSWSN